MFDTNSFRASTAADTSKGLDEMYVESFTVIFKSVFLVPLKNSVHLQTSG